MRISNRILLLQALGSRAHEPATLPPKTTPEPSGRDAVAEVARLEDLIAAAVAELARRGPSPAAPPLSLGAGVLASLMARYRGGARQDA